MKSIEGHEGVIKYISDFEVRSLSPDVLTAIVKLDQWRQVFFDNNLIGEDPDRYGGYGFGNLSKRLDPQCGLFAITSSQTSGLPFLQMDQDYSVIKSYDLVANTLSAYGLKEASSEALTHAVIYDYDPLVQAIFHAHHPGIWNATEQLGIPATHPGVEYGTPQMAQEMQRLLGETDAIDKRIISMLGHEDGIITFGQTADEAGAVMLNYLQKASDLKARFVIKAALLGRRP